MQKKTFELGAILSFTTGRMLTPTMKDLYDLHEHLYGWRPYTATLAERQELVGAVLLEQFPQLANAQVKHITEQNYPQAITELNTQFGEYHEVVALPTEGAPDDPADMERDLCNKLTGGRPFYTLDLTESDDDTP